MNAEEQIKEIIGKDAYNEGAFMFDDNKMRFCFTPEELQDKVKELTNLMDQQREEAVREIEDGLYEAINPYGDLLFDVLEESKVGVFGKDVIMKNQDNYDVFRETKTRIRSYFKTLDGHIPSVSEKLSQQRKQGGME